jgi:hypothetical protein
MLAGLKKFDVHTKAIEGVHQQTLLGAILTLVTTVFVFILLFSEISLFLKIDVVSRMVIDKSVGFEAVRVEFDVTFPVVSCDGFTFTQEVTRGTLHLHDPKIEVNKEDIQKTDPNDVLGCRLKGSFLTDKFSGNFRFHVGPQNRPLNMTHIIHKLAFVPTSGLSAKDKLPHISDVFNQSFIDEAPGNTRLYQYNIMVVPTQYKTLYGELSFLNQYSVIEKAVPPEYAPAFLATNGMFMQNFQGMIFAYDFNPVISYFVYFFTRCSNSLNFAYL